MALKHLSIDPRALSTGPATPSAKPLANSVRTTPQVTAAKQAAERLFKLLPPLDVGDPKSFIAATVQILSQYPVEVMQALVDPVRGIPGRTDRPTLKTIKQACDEFYAPIERRYEREEVERRAKLCLPPPREKRTPEQQARIDAQVARAREQIGIPEPKKWIVPMPEGDGKHFERIAADLAQRRARREEEHSNSV